MYEKLDKLREELAKAKKKREEAERKVKLAEAKLREAENSQILMDVNALQLSPEQLAEFLHMIASGGVYPTKERLEEVRNLALEENESEEEKDEM